MRVIGLVSSVLQCCCEKVNLKSGARLALTCARRQPGRAAARPAPPPCTRGGSAARFSNPPMPRGRRPSGGSRRPIAAAWRGSSCPPASAECCGENAKHGFGREQMLLLGTAIHCHNSIHTVLNYSRCVAALTCWHPCAVWRGPSAVWRAPVGWTAGPPMRECRRATGPARRRRSPPGGRARRRAPRGV